MTKSFFAPGAILMPSKPLIVLAAGLGLALDALAGGEILFPVAVGNDRLGRADRTGHPALGIVMINKRAIFVADPEAAVAGKRHRFIVQADTAVGRGRQIRKVLPARAHAARIKTRGGSAIAIGQQKRPAQPQIQPGLDMRRARLRMQGKIEHLHRAR